MRAIQVGAAGDRDLEEWDRYVRASAHSSIYHLSAWRRIFGEAFGYRTWLLAARNAGGGICGVLPLYLVEGLFSRRLVAVPFRDRGGPVFDNLEALAALLGHAWDLARQERAGLLLKTLVPLPAAAGVENLTRSDHWVNSRMSVAGLDRAAFWERIGGKTRNKVRQAEHRGLKAALATSNSDAAASWYHLHLQTQHRLGLPPFPLRFFSLMLETLRPSGNIELLEVRIGDEPCAATLLLMHRDSCIYGYSASSAEGQRLRANDLMLLESLTLAAVRGLTLFDFGSDSPSQESLLLFKRKWGAQQQPIPVYASGGEGISDSSDSRYALARRMFRAMPASLSSWIGSRVVRRFG